MTLEDRIVKLYKKHTIQEISNRLGISKTVVSRTLHKYNIPIVLTKVDNLNFVEVCNYYSKHSLRATAIKFGCSPDQIKYYLRKRGVNTSKHEGERRIHIDPQTLLHYYESHNMRECAEKFGCSVGTIRCRLREFGIIGKPRFTESSRQLISKSNKRRWEDEQYREVMAKHRANMPKVSSIQLILYSMLDDLKVNYYREYEDRPDDPQTIIGPYNFDCVVECKNRRDLLIDCHGDYWHRSGVKDGQKLSYFINNLSDEYDYKILWEHDFDCKDKVYELLRYWLGLISLPKSRLHRSEVVVKPSLINECRLLLSKYHYPTTTLRGLIVHGVYYAGELIGTVIYSAVRGGSNHKKLARFCINPCYNDTELIYYVLQKSVEMLSRKIRFIVYDYNKLLDNNDIKTMKQFGFKYKEKLVGGIVYVDDNGWAMYESSAKKRARDAKMSIDEFANKFGYKKKKRIDVLRFIYNRPQRY